MSLVDAALSGDHLTALEALRDLLAAELDGCESSRDVAALAARFADVLAQIEAVKRAKPEQKGTTLDELRARRSARVSGAAGS